jgi:hypothetical protein
MTDSQTEAFPLTTTTIDPDAHHWTPQVQRAFLEALAVEGSIRGACRIAGKSWRTAYALRMQRRGEAFALGWDGAVLIARARLSDELMERALEGQEESVMRDGDTIVRRRIDNRLAMSLLSRLDRMAEADPASRSSAGLARIVAQDFEAFLDLIESGGTGEDSAAFIAVRQALLPAPPAAEKGAETEEKAPPEQCDLLTQTLLKQLDCATVTERAQKMHYWFDERNREWRTDFPFPEGFDGEEDGEFGEEEYSRTLDEEEAEVFERASQRINAEIADAGYALRAAILSSEGPSGGE